MPPHDVLIAWVERWLLTGDVVFCKTCGASQHRANKISIFEHHADCRLAVQDVRPWHELESVLAAVRLAKMW